MKKCYSEWKDELVEVWTRSIIHYVGMCDFGDIIFRTPFRGNEHIRHKLDFKGVLLAMFTRLCAKHYPLALAAMLLVPRKSALSPAAAFLPFEIRPSETKVD